MESVPLYCFPTSAQKEWSFYLLFVPNPSLPITVLTHSILQPLGAHSICYFLFFSHITSSFSALKFKGKYGLIISVSFYILPHFMLRNKTHNIFHPTSVVYGTQNECPPRHKKTSDLSKISGEINTQIFTYLWTSKEKKNLGEKVQG